MATPRIPDIAEIENLSEAAWLTGRAFANASDRAIATNIRDEFFKTKSQLSALSQALKNLVRILKLSSTQKFINATNLESRLAFAVIVNSCQKTLDYLRTTASSYRKESQYSAPYIWCSQTLLENYDSLCWSPGGGGLLDLLEYLYIHTITVEVVKTVLEKSAFSPFNSQIPEIAKKILSLHDDPSFNPGTIFAEIKDSAQSLSHEVLFSPFSPFQSAPSSPQDPVNFLGQNESYQLPNIASRIFAENNKSQNSECLSPKSLPAASDKDLPDKSYFSLDVSGHNGTPSSNLTLCINLFEGFQNAHAGTTPARFDLETPLEFPVPEWKAPEPPLESNPPVWNESSSSASTLVGEWSHAQLTSSSFEDFIKTRFTFAAILCEVRVRRVEYVVRFREEIHQSLISGDHEIDKVMDGGRLCLIRERKMSKKGNPFYVLSAWAFSDDMQVRFQQILDETMEIVPWTSYHTKNKVSITARTTIIFHSVLAKTAPVKVTETGWVNYYLDTDQGSYEFQNELYGYYLRGCFKTERTVRMLEGIVSFASHEQMCAMENLRVWYDPLTGAYHAIIHFSALFRKGYLKFYLNNIKQPITLKSDGYGPVHSGRSLKIKGLAIPASSKITWPPALTHRDSQAGATKNVKTINSAKIEFTQEADKMAFVELVKEAQREMVEIGEPI